MGIQTIAAVQGDCRYWVKSGPPDREMRLPVFPSEADIVRLARHVRKVPILLKKSFRGNERKFLEPLMRFASDCVRDDIVSSRNR